MQRYTTVLNKASKGLVPLILEGSLVKPSSRLSVRTFSSNNSTSDNIFGSNGKDSSFHSNVDSAIGGSTKDENMQRYKADKQTAAKWLDIGIVKKKGRAYDANSSLIPIEHSIIFPSVQCTSMDGANRSIPLDLAADHKVKLVVFSFKHYGFTLVRSWLEPFLQKFPSSEVSKNKIAAVEICFIEYGFLAMAKTVFINSIKNNIADSQFNHTYLTFGGVTDFASQLSLPNVYTGYAYLLDEQNRVRWHGCGEATEEEVKTLLTCAQQLVEEQQTPPSTGHHHKNKANKSIGKR